MTAYLPQREGGERESERETQREGGRGKQNLKVWVFFNLILKVTSHHVNLFPVIRSKLIQPLACGGVNTTGLGH